MDYTTITTAIVTTGLVAGIAAAAAIKVVPLVAKWGASVLTRMFGR